LLSIQHPVDARPADAEGFGDLGGAEALRFILRPGRVYRKERPSQSFMRVSVGSSGVFVGKLAMFVSRGCVLLGFFVLAERMVMLGLNMVVRGGVVMSGRREMMFPRRMLLCLCHLYLLLSSRNELEKKANWPWQPAPGPIMTNDPPEGRRGGRY
jgi:hypothetical protein